MCLIEDKKFEEAKNIFLEVYLVNCIVLMMFKNTGCPTYKGYLIGIFKQCAGRNPKRRHELGLMKFLSVFQIKQWLDISNLERPLLIIHLQSIAKHRI